MTRTRLMRFVIAIAFAAMFVSAGAAQTPGSAAPPFRAAVEAHITAIAARNLAAVLPTITSGNDLTMIAPNGFKWDTRQQYIDFHRQWFATKDEGKLTWRIVRIIESPRLGHALIRYRYDSKDPKDPSGKVHTIDSWLTLTFALEQGTWRLVFDQNTAVAPDVAAAKP